MALQNVLFNYSELTQLNLSTFISPEFFDFEEVDETQTITTAPSQLDMESLSESSSATDFTLEASSSSSASSLSSMSTSSFSNSAFYAESSIQIMQLTAYFFTDDFEKLLYHMQISSDCFFTLMLRFINDSFDTDELVQDFLNRGFFYCIFMYLLYKSEITNADDALKMSSCTKLSFESNCNLMPGFEQWYFAKYYPLYQNFTQTRT